MIIREALASDNEELIMKQALCPVGKDLIVRVVNSPDFWGRARAYRNHKVFVACENGEIVGSAACAIRKALINGHLHNIGYEFQYFTVPDSRRKGVAKSLHQQIESLFNEHNVALSYLLVLEGNTPSINLFESLDFIHERTINMLYLPVFKEMEAITDYQVRPLSVNDFSDVANLSNQTWANFNLYEPLSSETIKETIERIPEYSTDNAFVLESEEGIVSCLGYWDLNRVTTMTVEKLSLKLRVLGLLLDVTRPFYAVPRSINSGELLKQWCLTPIAFTKPYYFEELLRHLNNLALEQEIDQLFFVYEPDQTLQRELSDFFTVNVQQYLFVKQLIPEINLDSRPVLIDGIDL